MLTFSLISCQTVTIRPDGAPGKLTSPPDYQKTRHFFLGGLIGEAVVPTGKICAGKKAVQLQSQTTFIDGLVPVLISVAGTSLVIFSAFSSLFDDMSSGTAAPTRLATTTALMALAVSLAATIYTPKTAKVWCGEEKTAQSGGGVRLLEAI